MIDFLIDADQNLLIFLNSLGSEFWDPFWLLVTNKFTTVPIYLLLTALFFRVNGVKKTVLFFVLAILLVTLSDQLANVFKYGFERLRPCHEQGVRELIRIVKGSCGGKFSYFSAHASTGMALAVFFTFNLKQRFRYLVYLLPIMALMVGYSRIYIGVHYPLDVLTGFLIGGTLGFLGFLVFQKGISKLNT